MFTDNPPLRSPLYEALVADDDTLQTQHLASSRGGPASPMARPQR
jgi:hypothetical protein